MLKIFSITGPNEIIVMAAAAICIVLIIAFWRPIAMHFGLAKPKSRRRNSRKSKRRLNIHKHITDEGEPH